ncbi:hypothetical protein RB195_002824 [Necator americanus]|uniref:Uncharacterized protein n=1 Tax=Necator americanus TaxID=51031 RepID=A0ABR1DKV0_NECAM
MDHPTAINITLEVPRIKNSSDITFNERFNLKHVQIQLIYSFHQSQPWLLPTSFRATKVGRDASFEVNSSVHKVEQLLCVESVFSRSFHSYGLSFFFQVAAGIIASGLISQCEEAAQMLADRLPNALLSLWISPRNFIKSTSAIMEAEYYRRPVEQLRNQDLLLFSRIPSELYLALNTFSQEYQA